MKRTVTALLVLATAILLLAVGSATWAAQLPHEVVWNQNRNQNLWTHDVDRDALAAQVSQPKPTDRGRVQIDPQSLTLVADNGLLIRGETLRSSALIFDKNDPNSRINIERAMDIDIWTRLVERHNLNTVRYLLYRPPQNWSGGPGWDCPVERCFPTVQDALPYIDAAVEIAADMGMYIVLDYHPVLGYSADDARAWWRVLAPRYKDRTHVIYELINEPRGGASEMTAADIAFQEELYQLVRSLAPETHIIMWSFANYSSAVPVVEAAEQINYDNASVGYHPYAWHDNVLQTLRNRGYPVIATEVGDNLGSPPPDSRGYRWKTERQEAANIAWLWLDGAGWGKPWENRDPVPVTWPRDPKTGRPTVTTPVIEPNGGNYAGSVNVSLSFPDPSMLGAEIRYTLDGAEPTAQSKLYQGPFTINSSTTVKAKGFKQDYNNSSSATAAFTIGAGPTFTPTATGAPPTATPEQTATAPPVSGAEELLTNGTFEANFDAWNKNPGHSWVQMRGTSADKKIATWPWNNYVIWQGGLRIVQNEQYQACVTLQTNTPYSYQVNLRVVDLASNQILGLDEVLSTGENCFNFSADGSTEQGGFVLAFSGLSSPGTRLDFDDLSLQHLLPTPTPTATATATATPTVTPSPTWTPSPSPTATATFAPQDLLQNGSFDNGFANWKKEPGHSWVQMRGSAADPHIAVWPWNNYRIWQDGLPLTEGAQYEACVEMFTNTAYPFAVRLQIQDGSNNAGLQEQLSMGENCFSFTATRSSDNGRFELVYSGLEQPGTRINFDNLRLRRVS